MDLKTCTRCGETKTLDLFAKNRSQSSGIDPQCKACHCEKQRLRREQGLDVATRRARDLRKKYGITQEDWDRMFTDQNGKCGICPADLTTVKKICVDHCHSTGVIRGLLCWECNLAIGQFKDDISLLMSAIKYLSGETAVSSLGG